MRLAAAAKAAQSEQVCKVARILQGFDEDDMATFVGWLDEGRSVTWIAYVLKKADIEVHRDTIRVHLRGLCVCSEETPLRGVVEWVA